MNSRWKLLFWTSVLCLVSLPLGWRFVRAQRQERAVKVLRDVFGEAVRLTYDYETGEWTEEDGVIARKPVVHSAKRWDYGLGEDFWHPVVHVEIRIMDSISLGDFDVGMAALAELDRLESLELYCGSRVTAGQLQRLKCGPILKLFSYCDSIDDAKLRVFGEWRNLRSLVLATPYDAPGLRSVTDFSPLENCQNLRRFAAEFSNANDELAISLSKIPGLWQLDLESNQLTDRGAAALSNLKELRSLDLASNTEITSVGIKDWNQLKQLQSLWLFGSQVDGRLFDVVAQLPELRQLYAWCRQGDCSALAQSGVCQKLERLYISGDQVAPEAWTAISQFPQLKTLHICSDTEHHTTDSDPKALPEPKINVDLVLPDGLRNVSEFHLHDYPLTPMLWQSICKLPAAVSISINRAGEVSAVVSQFAGPPTLKHLKLRDCILTPDALDRLLELNPQLERLSLEGSNFSDADIRAARSNTNIKIEGFGPQGDCATMGNL